MTDVASLRALALGVLAAAGSSAVITAAWIRFARSRRIEDQPGQRRLHAEVTPRGGGVSIAIVALTALLWLTAGGGGAQWAGFAAGLGLFAAIGLADDVLPIPVLLKFAAQFIAATVLVLALAGGLSLAMLVIAIVACVYVVNVWNFMDGSNGMVALQSLVIAVAVAMWPGQPDALRWAALLLAAGCAGFLPFNFPRAHVFLGDVGSHALGAGIFGILLLSWILGTIGLAQSLLMASAFVLDSGFTLLRRLVARKPVWRAHREHLYQYAVRSGMSHVAVGLAYAGWALLMVVLAGSVSLLRSNQVMWITLSTICLVASGIHYALRRRWLQRTMARKP